MRHYEQNLAACSGINPLEEINCVRTSFSQRSALIFDINSVRCVLMPSFYRKQGSQVSGRAARPEISRFQSASTIRHLSAVACHLVYCRIGATSVPRYVQYDSNIPLLAPVCFIFRRYRNQIKERCEFAFRTSSTPLSER